MFGCCILDVSRDVVIRDAVRNSQVARYKYNCTQTAERICSAREIRIRNRSLLYSCMHIGLKITLLTEISSCEIINISTTTCTIKARRVSLFASDNAFKYKVKQKMK